MIATFQQHINPSRLCIFDRVIERLLQVR
jgi:hypothetical protein